MNRVLITGAALAAAIVPFVLGDAGAQDTQKQQQTPKAQAPTTARAAKATPPASFEVGGMVSCRPGADLSTLLSRLSSFADTDGDGKIAKNEARAATNFVIGGFFFRADENGDGTVTPEEGLAARKELMNQNPGLAALLSSARQATGQSPFAQVAQMVDVKYGKPLKAEEARRAARSAVDGLYQMADTNADGAITMDEARQASWQGAQALGSAGFDAADANGDGALTLAEFQRALETPAQVAFQMSDANNNGQLTQEEASVALGNVMKQFGTAGRQ